MTTPPDFSQSSTPFRLLAPRHPPHALTSLAALFAPSPRVTALRSRTLKPASINSNLLGKADRKRRCCLSSKARVLSLARSRPPPSPATQLPRSNQTGSIARSRHQTSDATSHTPSCQRSASGSTRGSRHSSSHRTAQVAYGRVPSQDYTASPLWPCCCVHGIENNMGGRRPCQPGPRDFSVPRSPSRWTGATRLESSPIT